MPGYRYLLDTNILSSLLKQPSGTVAGKVHLVGEDAICTSIVVACELRYGAMKKGSSTLTDKVKHLLSAVDVLPLDEDADEKYADAHGAGEGRHSNRGKRLSDRCPGAISRTHAGYRQCRRILKGTGTHGGELAVALIFSIARSTRQGYDWVG